jgi:hypothetical protein
MSMAWMADARTDVARRRGVVPWHVGRDDGSDDAAILGANAVALPPGRRQDRRDAPGSADLASLCRGPIPTSEGRGLVMPRRTQPELEQQILLHKVQLRLPRPPPPTDQAGIPLTTLGNHPAVVPNLTSYLLKANHLSMDRQPYREGPVSFAWLSATQIVRATVRG